MKVSKDLKKQENVIHDLQKNTKRELDLEMLASTELAGTGVINAVANVPRNLRCKGNEERIL
jgi:hypothetical protein